MQGLIYIYQGDAIIEKMVEGSLRYGVLYRGQKQEKSTPLQRESFLSIEAAKKAIESRQSGYKESRDQVAYDLGPINMRLGVVRKSVQRIDTLIAEIGNLLANLQTVAG